MRKLDRPGWAAGLTFVSFGVRFGVRSDDPRALEHIEQYLPPGTRAASRGLVERLYSIRLGDNDGVARRGVRRFNLLYANHALLARTYDTEELFERFESDLQLAVAEGARRRVFIHAGV